MSVSVSVSLSVESSVGVGLTLTGAEEAELKARDEPRRLSIPEISDRGRGALFVSSLIGSFINVSAHSLSVARV